MNRQTSLYLHDRIYAYDTISINKRTTEFKVFLQITFGEDLSATLSLSRQRKKGDMSKLTELEQYLVEHDITAYQLSLRACLRYSVVWNATKGNPVKLEHAKRIRATALALTGVPYIGTIAVLDLPVEQQPTLRMKRTVLQPVTERG